MELWYQKWGNTRAI